MAADLERYATYYTEKLWSMLPAIYRSLDVEDPPPPDPLPAGPLRELVARIGAQAAILRASFDRLWDDQSIETCDEWVIPYIGDLLETKLVASLGGRGWRLDVAKTIYYRRRKGTVSILEEIANDVTGWDARVVEFFRVLTRTRHNLDPALGLPSATDDPQGARELQWAQGLVGVRTATPLGGFADVRDAYGATKAHSAFDEFSHTADLRRGARSVGWHNIPRLGVFLWRLKSFGVRMTTPVALSGCPGHYTFDPTGRFVPLFARQSPRDERYGSSWTSPQEWQLPVPITKPLLRVHRDDLHPDSFDVLRQAGSFFDPMDASLVKVYPELGRFKVDPAEVVRTTYHYGFMSAIGAGPYDRRVLGSPAPAAPAPVTAVSGGGSLAASMGALPATGTLRIEDSLTYGAPADLTGVVDVRIEGENRERPVIRTASPKQWVIDGATDAVLQLRGLLVSGCDVVLRGDFAEVTISSCTLDPGNSGESATPPAVFARSADSRDLVPARLWIEGSVGTLTIERSITGPVRSRHGGLVRDLLVRDSIVQGIRTAGFGPFATADVVDMPRLATRLEERRDAVSDYLWGRLSAPTRAALAAASGPPDATLSQALLDDLNAVVNGNPIWDPVRFAGVVLAPATRDLAASNPPAGPERVRANRLLLESAFRHELADLALGSGEGEVALERVTVFGPCALRRLYASETILDDLVVVDDTQRGCVRFSAWSTGSVLPRKYESVEVAAGAALFTTRAYGAPGYAQLLDTADRQIVSTGASQSIVEGGPTGSEMGAFARELNPIKLRSILIKYGEYMPLGLAPVLVPTT